MIIGISGKKQTGKDTVGAIIQYLIAYDSAQYTHPQTQADFNSYLTRNRINTFEIHKFADTLKDIVCLILGCTREQLEDEEFKNASLGDEWIRYSYADGFTRDSYGNTSMLSVQCTKEVYEKELRINWQTAYKHNITPRLILQQLGTEFGRDILHKDIWVNSTINKYLNSSRSFIMTDVRFPNELIAIKKIGGFIIRLEREGYGTSMVDLANAHESETALDGAVFDYTIHNYGSIEDLIKQVKTILIKEEVI